MPIPFSTTFGTLPLRSNLAKQLAAINLSLSKYEMHSNSIEGVLANIQKFEESYEKVLEEIQYLKQNEAVLKDRGGKLRDEDIPEETKKIKEAQDEIDRIMVKAETKSLDQYRENLKLKRDFERTRDETSSVLDSHFHKINEDLAENIAHWEQMVNELKPYEHKSQDIVYDQNEVDNLKERRKTAEEELHSLAETMESFQDELREIEKGIQQIFGFEAGHIPCTASVDLAPIRDKLQEFICSNENNRDNALRALRIFEEIETEEKNKVSELFGERSPISEYYRDITGGLYKTVLYEQHQGVQVERRDGKVLAAARLSGGAYDQLYLSIRLALGEKLLKGKLGFFIVDDPFIKADPERLRRQMAVLRKICEKGWQIIYFSAKGEVKDALDKDIQEGLVNYYEIQNISI